MRQDNRENKQEVISIEEYLRKRKVIGEQEKQGKKDAADAGISQGAAIGMAELMYI